MEPTAGNLNMCQPGGTLGKPLRRSRAGWLSVAVASSISPAAFADELPNRLTDPVTAGVAADADSTRYRIDGSWGFADRHRLRMPWFNNSTSDSRTLEREVEWAGVTYPVSARLNAEFNFDIYELACEYAFLRKENCELSGTVGLPLPVVSLRGLWILSHDFWLDASVQYFALSIDEYDGSLADFRVAAIWQPKSWLGVGVGYNQFGVDVDVDKGRFDG